MIRHNLAIAAAIDLCPDPPASTSTRSCGVPPRIAARHTVGRPITREDQTGQ
jgi:hypothetical protein